MAQLVRCHLDLPHAFQMRCESDHSGCEVRHPVGPLALTRLNGEALFLDDRADGFQCPLGGSHRRKDHGRSFIQWCALRLADIPAVAHREACELLPDRSRAVGQGDLCVPAVRHHQSETPLAPAHMPAELVPGAYAGDALSCWHLAEYQRAVPRRVGGKLGKHTEVAHPPFALDDVLVGVHQLVMHLCELALAVILRGLRHLLVPSHPRDFRRAGFTVEGTPQMPRSKAFDENQLSSHPPNRLLGWSKEKTGQQYPRLSCGDELWSSRSAGRASTARSPRRSDSGWISSPSLA